MVVEIVVEIDKVQVLDKDTKLTNQASTLTVDM